MGLTLCWFSSLLKEAFSGDSDISPLHKDLVNLCKFHFRLKQVIPVNWEYFKVSITARIFCLMFSSLSNVCLFWLDGGLSQRSNLCY